MENCRKNGIDNTKPRKNEFYRKYIKFDTFSKRVTYLKTLTNTLLADHMDSKGWDSKQPGCRFPDCGSKSENLQHVMTHLHSEEGSKSALKSISKSINAEKRMKRGARISYDIVRLNASAAELIAEEINGQRAPTFKIRKIEKEGQSNKRKKKRGERGEGVDSVSEPRPRRRRQK